MSETTSQPAKHVIEFHDGKQTYCDDVYCTGHRDRHLRCSCGWTHSTFGRSGFTDEVRMMQIEHVLRAEGLLG